MKKSYLNSERNSAVPLKPSMTIRLLLMVLFVCLFTNTTVTAQISTLSAWTNTYHGTLTAQQNVTYTVPAGSGTNRILVVAIASSRTTLGTRTVTLTYGGQTLTSVAGDIGITTIRQHTQLYYLKEAGLDAATSTTLAITVSGGLTRVTDVFAAVFDGVDQTNPITDSKTYSSGTGTTNTPVFGTALTVNANDLAIEIISSVRAANPTPRTISTYAANWTTASVDQTWTTTDGVRNAVANRSIPTVNLTDLSSTTFSGSALASMTGMSLKCAPMTPTITSLGSTSGCPGSSITINGTNLNGAGTTAANVTIGGTPVASISSNTGTKIIAVVGSGTTGYVSVTSSGVTVDSTNPFTVNTAPTVAATPATQTIANDTAITDILISNPNAVSGTTFSWTRTNTTNITGTTSGTGDITGTLTNTTTTVQTTTFDITATAPNTCGSTTSVTVTVLPDFNISYHQAGNDDLNTQTMIAGACASIDGSNNDMDLWSGSGNGSTSYQWQSSVDSQVNWGNLTTTRANTSTNCLIPSSYETTLGQYFFRLKVTLNSISVYSDVLTLNVIDLTATQNIVGSGGTFTSNQSVCSTATPPAKFIEITPAIGATFINAAGVTVINPDFNYQWQKASTVSGPFTDVTTGSGRTSSEYQAPLTSATVYYRRVVTFPNDGNCTTEPSLYSNVITVSVDTATPVTTATATNPSCTIATGSITVTSPGGGITYKVTGPSPSTTVLTNTTGIFSGLATGSYTVNSSNACNNGNASNKTVTIDPFVLVTNTWDGSAWDVTDPPTAEQKLVFDGDYSENINIEGCSCQVNALTDVTIKAGHTMTITNEVSVDVDGVLTFEDKSSLVQINDVTNTGDIDYLRTTDTGIYNTDYIYWSSPVEGITLGDVSQNRTLSDKYYSYVPTATGEDWQQESSLTAMESGSGYIIRGSEYSPSVQPGNKYTATFTGVPNNGHYEITPIFENKSYLLGNPYPSALDADTFLANNSGVLNGTLYFWTHNTDMQARGSILSSAGSGAFAYTTNDYATYNATGGVSAAPPDPGNTGPASSPLGTNNNYNTPSGKIATGQGFFASTKTGLTNTKIVFDNTMRVGVNGITGNNSQFFKTKKPNGKTANTIEKNRVWLNLTNTEGAFKQTLVGYLTDATNEYEDRFDGESFDGNEFVDFYSVNQDKNLTIQGRALPFDENDEVPLGYRTTINGDFTINIDQVDGSLTNQAVFIEDKLTNTVTDLKSGNYTFNTAAGTFDDRFVLKYTNKTLSVDAMDKEDGILVLYSNNYNTLIIHNNVMDSTVNTVTLYNIMGQKISNWDVKDSEQTTIQIPIKSISSGIYIVKVNTTKGESSKKIIVN
jgi:hypothetical protein